MEISNETRTQISTLENQLVEAVKAVRENARYSRAHHGGSMVPAGGNPYSEHVDDAHNEAERTANEILGLILELTKQGLTAAAADALLESASFKPIYAPKKLDYCYTDRKTGDMVYVYEESPRVIESGSIRYDGHNWETLNFA